MPEPEPEHASDPRLQFVWEEARRAVELQVGNLNEVRGRAVAILSVGSAAAFIASAGLAQDTKMHWTTWLGIGAFAMIGLLGAFVLMPRTGWVFFRKADVLLSAYVDTDPPASLDDMHRELAKYLREDHEGNEKRLQPLYWAFTSSCILLAVEILAFVWDLRGRR